MLSRESVRREIRGSAMPIEAEIRLVMRLQARARRRPMGRAGSGQSGAGSPKSTEPIQAGK